MQGFRDVVDTCGLVDLGYTGTEWTWEKKVAGGSYTRVCLDQALVTPDWSLAFPMVAVHHLHAACSKHCAIWLRPEVDN